MGLPSLLLRNRSNRLLVLDNGFFQLPLRRFKHYTASMTSPRGMRQEETIKAIWADLDRRR